MMMVTILLLSFIIKACVKTHSIKLLIAHLCNLDSVSVLIKYIAALFDTWHVLRDLLLNDQKHVSFYS